VAFQLGKSTVSQILRSLPHSLTIIDADILAREAVQPGTSAFKRILNTFSTDLALRDPDSGAITGLDRIALGKRVFSSDEAARHRLNKSFIRPYDG